MKNRKLWIVVWLGFAVLWFGWSRVHAQDVILPQDIVWGIAWKADGTQIAAARSNGVVQLINAGSGSVVETFQSTTTARFISLAWSPDQSKIAAGSEDNKVFVWNATSGLLLRYFSGSYIFGLAWSPDSAKLAGIDPIAYQLSSWDISSGNTIFSVHGTENGIDWFQNRLVVGSGNGVVLINAQNGAFVKDIGLHENGVTTVKWSSDGSLAASGSMDGTIIIWDVIKSRHIVKLSGHSLPVTHLEWNAAGTQLASASYDGSVRVWDTESGHLLDVIQAGAPVLDVKWSPDGSRLAYSGDVAGIGAVVKIVASPAGENNHFSLLQQAIIDLIKTLSLYSK
jgi:WD40 repeat protein